MVKQQRRIEEFGRIRLGKPEVVSEHKRTYDVGPKLDKKTKDKIKKGKSKMLKGEFIVDSFKDKTKKKKKTGQTNLDKQLEINTKVLEEYGDLKAFDKHQKRFEKITPDEKSIEKKPKTDVKTQSPKDAYIEYMMKSTKEQLYRTAKAYKIKGISKMRKEQLVRAIIIEERIPFEKYPNIVKPNEDEYYIDKLAIKKLWIKHYDDETGTGTDKYLEACKEYHKNKSEEKKPKQEKKEVITIKPNKTNLNKTIIWSTSRFNYYKKSEVIDDILDLIEKGDNIEKEYTTGSSGASGHLGGWRYLFKIDSGKATITEITRDKRKTIKLEQVKKKPKKQEVKNNG